MDIDPRRIEVMDDRVAEIMRRKTPAEKLAIASSMWQSVQTMIVNALKQSHPDWSDEQIWGEARRRLSRGAI